MPAEIVVVGSGMITPVGLSTKETAASTRARIARLTSIEWRDSRFQPYTVGIVPDDALNPLQPDLENLPLTYREGRMLRLAEIALLEALSALPKSAGAVPLLLGLPEIHTTLPIKEPEFLGRLARQSGAALDLARSTAIPRGRASGLHALREACERLEQGKATFALAGGVDTYVDLYILGTLDLQKRIRNEVNPDGFGPGEGAGFLLLTTGDMAKKHGMTVLARVVANASGKEEGHIYSEVPYKGEGLPAAFEALFSAKSDLPAIDCIYSSFNGEHYWAKEFGVALVRNREHFLDPYQMEHPAECFGDLGAAHGIVMAGLAVAGLQRTKKKTPTLIFASSDYGDRAVTVLAGAA